MEIRTAGVAQAKNPAKMLMILLHGYGADGADLIDLGHVWGKKIPSLECIAPNAPFPCEQGMGYQWASLRNHTPEKMIQDTQHVFPALKKYIMEELDKRSLKIENLILMGFSQGAHLALHTSLLLAEQGHHCAGVMGYAGWMAIKTDSFKPLPGFPPVLLVHGAADTVVPLSGSVAAEKFFAQHGIPVTLHTHKNLGHSINIEGIQQGEMLFSILYQILRFKKVYYRAESP